MPLTQAVSGLIQGALGAFGIGAQSSINANTQRQNVDATNRANRELAEYQYSKDVEMWNRGNVYNDPMNQMARLKKAGLNPNLVYGSGSVSGNTTSQLPKYNAPTMSYNYTPSVDIPGMIGMFQDIQLRNAQIRNQEASAEFAPMLNEFKAKNMKWTESKSFFDSLMKEIAWEMQSGEYGTEVRNTKTGKQLMRFASNIGGMSEPTEFQKYSLDNLKASAGSRWASMNKMIQDTEYKRIQTDWLTGNMIANLVSKGAGVIKGFTSGAKGVKGSVRQGKTIQSPAGAAGKDRTTYYDRYNSPTYWQNLQRVYQFNKTGATKF